MYFIHVEYLRSFARASSNANLFTPQTSRDLIAFENAVSDHNRMYVMKVIGRDCSNQALWSSWIDEGKDAVGGEVPIGLMCGEGDGVFTVAQCQEASRYLNVPEDRFESVPNAGHLFMLEEPEKVTSFIKSFVEQFSGQ